MQFHDHGPLVVRQALHDPAFPQRTFPIESAFHHIGGKPEQRRVVAGVGKRDSMHVMGDVEVLGVDPLWCVKIKRMRAEHLTEPGHRKHSLCEARHKGIVVRNRPLQDGHGTDRQAYVPVGILGFEKPCV